MLKCTLYKTEGGRVQSIQEFYSEDRDLLYRAGKVLKSLHTTYNFDMCSKLTYLRRDNRKFYFTVGEKLETDTKGMVINSIEDVCFSVVLYVDMEKERVNLEYFQVVERDFVEKLDLSDKTTIDNYNRKQFEFQYYVGAESSMLNYATQTSKRKELLKELVFIQALNLEKEEVLDCVMAILEVNGGK